MNIDPDRKYMLKTKQKQPKNFLQIALNGGQRGSLRMMLGTFPKGFYQVTTSQEYFY